MKRLDFIFCSSDCKLSPWPLSLRVCLSHTSKIGFRKGKEIHFFTVLDEDCGGLTK